MKIAFLARNDGTDTRQGKICNSLHRLGYQVIYIGWDREPEREKRPILDPEIPRFIFRWRAGFGEVSANGWPQFFRYVARVLREQRPDVLHVRDEPLTAMAMPLKGWLYRYLVLDIFDSLAARHYSSPVLNTATLATRRLAHLGADRIIETSEQLRAMLGLFARKAIVVMNCPADPGEAVAQSLPSLPAVQICTGGSLSRQRDGLEVLLKAVDLLPPGEVEIQASGWLHDDYARDIFVKHPAVHYRWLETPEEFREQAARCDAISYLRGDAGETTYRSWVLPNRFFDAMSVGRPLIISSEMKMAPWATDQALGYLYTPGDHVGLAAIFRQLKERRQELPAYAARMRRLFTSQYTWPIMEERLHALYQGLGG
ncbi:MAG: glycosyltransferase family 4 protein [Chloroflexales bacterium]|nr:glycosyltransferase family 4 protein [Chloroflexales bacterium]